jgi:hypothetical protein
MPNFTIVLSENTARRLRKVVAERYGSKKGALSTLIEQGVKDVLDRLDTPRLLETFRAVRNGKTVAEGDSLESLARSLRQAKVDPRRVQIVSTRPLVPIARAGLRARPR